MKKTKIVLYAATAALFASAFIGSASAGKHAPKEVDLNAIQLEPGSIGVEVRDLLGALKPPKRDEFEGKDSFRTRQQAFASAKFFGDLTPASTIAVIAPAQGGGDVRYNYLQDSGVLVVRTGPTSLYLIAEQTSWKWTIIVNTTETVGYSKRMNGYGAVFEVSKKNISIDGLAFLRSNLALEPGQSGISHQLKLDGEEARDLAKNLALLYVGKLEPPYVVEYKTHESPTWDDPRDLSISHRAVVMDVAQIWTVNTRTGRVYHKAVAPFKGNYTPIAPIAPVTQDPMK